MRPTRAGVAGLVSALVLTACASASHTTTRLVLSDGAQGSLSTVPWGKVGSGWILAQWSSVIASDKPPSTTSTSQKPTVSLFLVTPTGGRYLVVPHTSDTLGNLVAWSGDGREALFTRITSLTATYQSRVISTVSVRTGRTIASFTLHDSATALFMWAAFTRPRGLAILVQRQVNNEPVLERYSLTGHLQLTYPASFTVAGVYKSGAIESRDGTRLVLGTTHGVAVVSNSGSTQHQVSIVGVSQCQPMRWWSSTSVLTTCFNDTSGYQRLFIFHLDNGSVTALTKGPTRDDLGDWDAWVLKDATYVQASGGCGYLYVAKLKPDGTTTPVKVPGAAANKSIFILGAVKNSLALEASLTCGPNVSIVWFTPSTNATTAVLGPPVNGGSVLVGLLYPDSRQVAAPLVS